MAVGDAVTPGHPLDQGDFGSDPHGGDQPQRCRGADRGPGAEPVDRDPAADHVEAGVGMHQRAGAVGEVSQARFHPRLGDRIESGVELFDLASGGPRFGFVGGSEVAPDPDDLDHPPVLSAPGGIHQARPLIGHGATAAQPRVDLQVDGGPLAHLDRSGDDLLQLVQRRDRQLHPPFDTLGQVVLGRVQPRHQRAPVAGFTHGDGLLGQCDPQVLGSRRAGGTRTRHHAVPVAIRFHHCQQFTVAGGSLQPQDVAPDRCQVDLRCGTHRVILPCRPGRMHARFGTLVLGHPRAKRAR